MAYPFVSGWNPSLASKARQEMLESKRYCTVIEGIETPKALSLSQFVLRPMEQGQAGTCWVHAAVCLAETFALAQSYDAFPICRRLVGWEGKQLEGGGNPTNGGAVTDALKAMIKGCAGIAHEELLPYSDSSRDLGTKPPQNVWDDAAKSDLAFPVDVRSNEDAITLIASKHPVAIGTWWPFNFDDHKTFMTYVGTGAYGHALTIIGYVKKGVWPGEYGNYAWWQVRNWHGFLYPPLPQELAAVLPGYKPDRSDATTDAWWRDDCLTELQCRGNFEFVSATDIHGINKVVRIPSFIDGFPV